VRRLAPGIAALALALIVAGCGAPSDHVAQLATGAVDTTSSTTTTTAPTTTTTPPDVPCTPARALQSYAPSELFPIDQMPAGSTMRRIQEARQLVVGVDENTPRLAGRDPASGEIDGFEIELVRHIALAILGDTDAVKFETVVTAEKVDVVADGGVDLTASANSITCDRWNDVSFSSEYFTAEHKLMVRNNSGITGMADLAGRTVCVTAGSSSVALLEAEAPDAMTYEVPARTDCLVALQNGDADAYFAHDTFLRGLHDQDPENTTILPDAVQEQHYGIAIAHEHEDLVRFVNALLERMRADGELERIANRWFGATRLPIPEAAPYRDGGPA
jgi:polar amino acid transport system substrate-binding protein